jgi:flagellar basal body-associated protein FliL
MALPRMRGGLLVSVHAQKQQTQKMIILLFIAIAVVALVGLGIGYFIGLNNSFNRNNQ